MNEHTPDEVEAAISKRMQDRVDTHFYFEREVGVEDKNRWVPAIVELAGLVRMMVLAKVKVPPNLTNEEVRELIDYLYEETEGGDFIYEDGHFWEEGTHSLNVLGERPVNKRKSDE